MRKFVAVLGLSAMALGLSACGSSGGIFGRDRPDEFAVSRAAPLVIPPDFAMVPPQPGAPGRADSSSANRQALEAMFGGDAARSAAERGLLNAADTSNSDPGVRSNVGDPDTATVDKGSATRDIIAAPEGDGQAARAVTPQ
ncbi:DUF3035 domain-containing protein [Rhizorhapis sp.]|uniref:DUF3035 domain-containing protein n=1 Tax=Rhizorhapis sp. TaxID=1968842 RepID=UPI002B470273|nr:DUF3035 domain-containing protein [Rhizorhapis sp.]HKR17068.1 DUF3035 domain-containing protein [Rhizorhapis sp.]HKX35793.1 DUF3035 domain-containing protein [Rhizorhapis sp.]